MFVRSFGGGKMYGVRLWVTAAALHALLLTASCAKPHRRSMPTQQGLPLSKGGWRPVVGSNGLIFGFGTAPLHAPSYKIQVPVLDTFQPSARPLVTRDATKMTSIAQSYRPTTLRTVPAAAPAPSASQPINSYHNPFAPPNNGLTHYKFIQNFPVDSVLIRNPHNPYAARPVFTKYPNKFKQQYPNHLQQLQQLNNVQPIHFGQQYQTANNIFGKPIDSYAKPTDPRKPQSSGTEIYKPEVYKLSDSDTAPQSISQQVKTAQQQSMVTPKVPVSPYPHYMYQDVYPPSILGSFGSFGVQSMKGRDPLFPTKTTYLPPQPTKQTVFNSFSFAPNFKTTPQFATTTPKLQTTANQIHYGSTWNDFQNQPTQPTKQANPTKLSNPTKIDPNVSKGNFKASPQDPFSKLYNDYRISTYNPTVQTTTFAYSNYHDYNVPSQQNAQIQNYYNQHNTNFNYANKKQRVHDSITAGVNQQTSQQYAEPPKNTHIENTPNSVPFKATYEVTENYSDDVITHTSPPTWPETQQPYYNQKSTEEAVTVAKQEYEPYSRPATTHLPDLTDEFAIVTEGEKGYDNSLSYDGQVESQSRRPLGDDFEPIGKHKLKDYYYKVSTPTYDDHSSRRTNKPTDASKPTIHEVTTHLNSNKDDNNNGLLVEPLPTLPPNKHFKRPSTQAPESVDKDRIRKRNKIRRRRPSPANTNKDSSTRKYTTSTTENPHTNEEAHTIRPRVRPTQSKPLPSLTTPTITTDLTTSAIPTISPTSPTIVKKKLIHRRPLTTTTEKLETTTPTYKDHESKKESPIMKISASSRPQLSKASTTPYEYRTSETPDYTHKQDEKDTPTSDIAVSLSDSLKTTSKTDTGKAYSFHRDTRPIEAKLEPVIREIITTESLIDSDEITEVTTITPRVETTASTGKISRPRLKNKYDRPRFSVKDYRSRLSSTTSSTEKPAESQAPKLRFPQRRVNLSESKLNDNDNATERKKFTPKDPRHKVNASETNEQTEKEIHSIRPNRQRQTTVETTEGTTQRISSRVRNGSRRPKPTEETTETLSTTPHSKRPLRKKVKDSELGESVQDVSFTDTTDKNDITSERTRSESAIMKIADKKHQDHVEHHFEHSKRVSDLTLAASKDYNTPGMFKTVSTNSRRIPNYFTIATDDPILPIEAFFPQLNQKKES